MNWTDERVELLKKLWSEGLSASQIAAQLGSVTRNAVIGKVHRLKLSSRGRSTAAPARQKKPTMGATASKSTSRAASVTRTVTTSIGANALQAQRPSLDTGGLSGCGAVPRLAGRRSLRGSRNRVRCRRHHCRRS